MFSILDSVDSTNNYAMAIVHAGLAKQGMACFALEQTEGRGQRTKKWISIPGQSINLSVIIEPPPSFQQQPFFFTALISIACYQFFHKYAGDETSVKWPNDIYWRDRKAGGILIENRIMGNTWKWCVVGIGININQSVFEGFEGKAVSLKQITGKKFDPILLARELHQNVMDLLLLNEKPDFAKILDEYNAHLFKKGMPVSLKKGGELIHTNIIKVDASGSLITKDSIERKFNFGEIEWML